MHFRRSIVCSAVPARRTDVNVVGYHGDFAAGDTFSCLVAWVAALMRTEPGRFLFILFFIRRPPTWRGTDYIRRMFCCRTGDTVHHVELLCACVADAERFGRMPTCRCCRHTSPMPNYLPYHHQIL